MAGTMETTTRNYKDLFSFKDFTLGTLVPKYFPDEEISTLNVGLLGLTSEQIGITTEDAFNTISVLVKEFFPNRASLPESIYTYAGIFQLSAYKGQAAACKFLIVFDEEQLNQIFEQYADVDSDAGECIYIAKETKIYVENIEFTLDYDIEITRKSTKLNSGEYVYGAKYITTEFTNSISKITSPYIKVRRAQHEYLAIEIVAHQCKREETETRIVDNTLVNYPIIDIEFEDVLAGFDVFYKSPTDTEYRQLETKVLNSLPETTPFCYYSMADEGVLRISFSTADSYFQPEFNSELKIVTYTCKGEKGNFDSYTGSRVSIVGDTERFQYNEDLVLAAKPVTDATGGASAMSVEELRRLVVESFSTANALTTDHDLELYFNNYELRFNNEIKFIKRRDDQAYRLFTGFLIMRNDDYVYPTNTLDISINYLDLYNPDGGYLYTLDPGYIFKYESNTNNRVTPMIRDGLFTKTYVYFQDSPSVAVKQHLYEDYFKWLKKYPIDTSDGVTLEERDIMTAISYIDLNDESTWVPFKQPNMTFRHWLNNNTCICPKCKFASDINKDYITYAEVDNTDYDQEITDEMYGNKTWLSFDSELKHATYIGEDINARGRFLSNGTPYNPLDDMKDIIEVPVCPVCGYIGMKVGTSVRDYMITVFDTDDINKLNKDMNKMKDSRNRFLFSNPFLISITKHPGLVSYYSTIVKQDSLVDFQEYNTHAPLQFILNQVHVVRPLNKSKEYTINATILPSVNWDIETLIPGVTTEEYVPRRTKTKNNYVRMFMAIESDGEDACWMEMVPTGLNEDDQIIFECKFKTADHVTNGNKMQIEDYTDLELGYHPKEWIEPEPVIDDEGKEIIDPNEDIVSFLSFDASEDLATYVGEGLNINDKFVSMGTSPFNKFGEEEEEEPPKELWDRSGTRGNFTYITNKSDHLIPMSGVNIKIYILTKEYDIPNADQTTNNFRSDPVKFNAKYYQWTNLYDTSTDRIDFIKPLNMIRSSIFFRDDRLSTVTKGDCYVYSMPFLKYTLLTHYKDEEETELRYNENGISNFEMFTYFFDKFNVQYDHMNEVLSTVIRNASHIDMKFYNTYGRSNNYIIGDADEIIDRVNMSICFHVYLIAGTDFIKARDELKNFIKNQIEQVNEFGSNDLNVSNLMRKIEVSFPYVDHLKFAGFNGKVVDEEYITRELDDNNQLISYGYSTEYQTIRNIVSDLSELTRDERFAYVPEMLCVNKDQISLMLFEM